ncbi:MAG TPA: radical SAM protein [Vicinamibacteria bacterium]|jgi:DNA repair photolyase
MGQQDLREKGGVTYRELRARSLLNKCDAPRLPFTWTVNPYRGCAMGCRYCYATYTHEFMGIATPEDFHTLVYVKVGGDEETARRLAAVVRKGERIALGTATDPYQPGEAESRVTRRFLEMVARHRGVRLGITTKGALVLRDLDVLKRIGARSEVSVHVSLNSPRADLLRRIEPLAPPPEVRIEVMRRLVEAGVETWLGLAPILPALTDHEADLDRLLGQVRDAGVRHLFTNMLFLRSPTREKYLRWLEAEFPRYLEAYRKAYDGRVYLQGAYRERMKETVERLKRKHGFEAGGGEDADARPPRQLLLFE